MATKAEPSASEANVSTPVTTKRTLSSGLDDSSGSPIENEVADYRAIHPMAVFALMAAVAGALSFVHWMFLLPACAAILLGIYALKKIKELPDIYSGTSLAQAGVALGMIFALSSITVATVWSVRTKQEAQKFAEHYCEVLNAGIEANQIKDSLWYRLAPETRKTTGVEEFFEQFQKQAETDRSVFESMAGPVLQIQTDARRSKRRMVVQEVESSGFNQDEAFALVRLALVPISEDHGHSHADGQPHEEDKTILALLILNGKVVSGEYLWMVKEITPNYQKNTKIITPEIDHGHDHGS